LPATLLTPLTSVTITRQATSGLGWSVSGRAGRLVWSDLLLYGSLGITGGGRKMVAVDTWSNVPGGPSAPGPGGATVNLGPLGPYVTTVEEGRHTGLLVGFGGEKPINGVWSVGLDYQYAAFPETTFHFTDPTIDVQGPISQFQPIQGASAAALPGDTMVKSSDHRIVVRLVYRFGFTLPFLR
jgi:opacity protein-like surface antigen